MKMKFNWGTALLIFFILYIGNLVRVVIKSRTVDHTLVVEDYYSHDIAYQDKVDKIENRRLLKNDLNIQYKISDQTLILSFGDRDIVHNASLEMYRPSDKDSDFMKTITPKNHKAKINLADLQQGKWKVRVEWNDEYRTYLKEEDIYIQ